MKYKIASDKIKKNGCKRCLSPISMHVKMPPDGTHGHLKSNMPQTKTFKPGLAHFKQYVLPYIFLFGN